MNRLAWHVGTIRWPASRHGFGIDLAAVLSRGSSASIRSRPIISDSFSDIGGPGGPFWPGPGAPQPRRQIQPVAVVPYEGTTMKTPLQIAFHNLPHFKVIESAIQEAVDRLEDTHDRITSCCVIVDQPHRHHKEGNLFQVRIDLKMPGAELVVKREP